jgi:hypothetical protein
MCFKRKWREFTPTQEYLNKVEDITTISKLDVFLDGITYIADDKDYWQTPEETLNRGKGDCDDFSRLTLDILVRIQKLEDVKFVIYTGYYIKDDVEKYSGHAVCVFPYKGKYSVFSNNRYFYNKDNLIDIGHIFYSKLKYMEVRNDEGNVLSRKFKLIGVF